MIIMKDRITIFAILFISVNILSYSQSTYIPDDVFEQTLIDLGYDSGTLNNYVETASLDKVTYLDISRKKIKDLTGIEDFINLQTLIYDDSLINILKESKKNAFIKLVNKNNSFNELDVSRSSNSYFYSNLVFNVIRN